MAEKMDIGWFDLNKYETVQRFDLVQWLTHLGDRTRLQYLLLNKETEFSSEIDSEIENYIYQIKNTPVGLHPTFEFSPQNQMFPFNTFTVKSTSIHHIKVINEDSRVKNAWKTWTDKKLNEGTENYSVFKVPVDLIIQEAPSPFDMLSTNLTINLSASDEQIKNDFSYWLENFRKATGYYAHKKNFSKKHLIDWTNLRILPYIDLNLVSMYENTPITQSKLGNLLFPDEIEIDVTERIRRTLKPKAEWLLNDTTLFSMQTQLYSKVPT